MFKHWMEIVCNHDNGCLHCCFTRTLFLRDISGKSKGFALEELFRSPFTELSKLSFQFNQKLFQSSVDGHITFFGFKLYYSLFNILMIKSSYWVDRALFNFLFNSVEILGHNWS